MTSGRAAIMLATIALIATLLALITPPIFGQAPGTTPSAPSYTSQSIVNAATQVPEALAPNTIATIYGTNLAFDTYNASGGPGSTANLPNTLGGVSVIVYGYLCNLFFVSPTQINFLVPYQIGAGNGTLIVTRQGLAGPAAAITIASTSPGMFISNGLAIATHLNGTIVSATAPASAGEIIVIYAAGLGRVSPDTVSGKIATSAAPIAALSQMQVLLAGKPCPPQNVLYAGLAPGFAGLYQINLLVPPLTPSNPEIRISVGTQISPPSVQLALQ